MYNVILNKIGSPYNMKLKIKENTCKITFLEATSLILSVQELKEKRRAKKCTK